MGIKRKKMKVGDLVVAKRHDEELHGREPIGLVVALSRDSHAGIRWLTGNPGWLYLSVYFTINYGQTDFPRGIADHWINRRHLRRISKRQP